MTQERLDQARAEVAEHLFIFTAVDTLSDIDKQLNSSRRCLTDGFKEKGVPDPILF